MVKEYTVLSCEECVGKVVAQRQGLYYCIRCRCNLTGSVKYKLIASCGENTVDLGICVPKDGCFGVDTKIPVKRLGEGELSFRLAPKHNGQVGSFIAVSANEPFGYIRQLQKAHFARENGIVGILLTKDQISSDKPTGQWSEPKTSE